MSRFNWGWKIAIVYFIFAASTVGFVVFALNTPVDLVRSDYYEQSLRQDTLITERARARDVGAQIRYQNGSVKLEISAEHPMSGQVAFFFYKPDQPDLDRTVTASFDETGTAGVDANSFKSGKWKVVARWSNAALQYETSSSFMKE